MTPPALVVNPSSSVLEVQSIVTVGNDAPSHQVWHAGQADPGGRGAFSSVITSPEVVAVGAGAFSVDPPVCRSACQDQGAERGVVEQHARGRDVEGRRAALDPPD